MNRLSIKAIAIIILLFHANSFAANSDNLVSLLSSNKTWSNFNWSDVYKSKLYTSFNWTKNDSSPSTIVEQMIDVEVANIKSKAIIREIIDKKVPVKIALIEFKKISGIDGAKVLSWCIDNYGKDYIESPIIIKLWEGVENAFYRYQWIIGNTVISYDYNGYLGKSDDKEFEGTIIFRDANKSELMKPDIKLDCKYTIFATNDPIKKHEYYVLESKKDGSVKNENMYSLGLVKPTITDTSIKLIVDTKNAHQELDINRLNGELLGTVYIKDNVSQIYKISGDCDKFEKLTPKF